MHDAVRSPLRIGIISFAHMHAAAYAAALNESTAAELVGIADSDTNRGQTAADKFGTGYYESVEALLSLGLDGVIVTGENIHHRSLVERAAEAGVAAILCEKPLATTEADARAMIDICARRGVRLATAFPCRYSPAARSLRDKVHGGMLGEIIAVRATNHGTMPGGWFVDKALSGGGAVIDHTVHVADLNRWILGREAVQVYAEIGSGFNHQDYDDTGLLTIDYEDGIFATLDTSWSRPKHFPTWGDVTLQFVGTKGVIDADLFAQTIQRYPSRDDEHAAWTGWGSDIDAALIADFLKLASGMSAPELATGDDGLRALQVALAAYRSAETGEPATI